jgi:DAK2 domain fusion protein YloV
LTSEVKDQDGTPGGAIAEQVRCIGKTFCDALGAGMAWLERHLDIINSLNVYPVPDGDTGTNMFLTMQAALKETAALTELTVGNVAQAVAHGALMGARGNSGVILSQLLRGVAKVLGEREEMSASDLAAALEEGANTAYKGVIRPVEGTILTVARESAAVAKKAAAENEDITQMLELTVEEARQSVARTPSLLPELHEAGVVDAGGQGFLTILEGALRLLRGDEIEIGRVSGTLARPTLATTAQYGYDTQLLLTGAGLPLEQIRAMIVSMGDSVLVVGDEKTIKVHVHTGRPGAVIDYCIGMGSVSDVVVENMQHQSEVFAAARADKAMPLQELTDIAVIAVAAGSGLHRVFRTLGVSAVVNGGQTMNPSTEDLLNALESVTAPNIILLPNNANVILTAQQTQQFTIKQVRVISTKTIPQGISALLAFNYQADLEENVRAMGEAAARIQTAEITKAVRSAQVNGLKVQSGQVIGLLNGELKASGASTEEVADEMLRQMQAGSYDIITVYYGQDSTPASAQVIAARIREQYPEQEIEVVDGGQPHYNYIISAE